MATPTFPEPVVVTHGPSDPDAPLVVLLHGRGSHEGEIISLAPHLPQGLQYAAVRAPIAEGGGFAWFANRGIGRPVAESLARGVPVLASDHGSVAEIAAAGGRFSSTARWAAAMIGFTLSNDLLIVVGARFDDRATGKLAEFAPDARVVHFDADASEVGKLRAAEVAVVGDLKAALAALTLRMRGGPALERLAMQGDGSRIDLPRALLGRKDCDFSFSGLKTAAFRIAQTCETEHDKADLADAVREIVGAGYDLTTQPPVRAALLGDAAAHDGLVSDDADPEVPVEPADGEARPAADRLARVVGEGAGRGVGRGHLAEHPHHQDDQRAGDQVGQERPRPGLGDHGAAVGVADEVAAALA